MTIDQVTNLLTNIKRSGKCPFEFIDAELVKLESEVESLKMLREFYERTGVPTVFPPTVPTAEVEPVSVQPTTQPQTSPTQVIQASSQPTAFGKPKNPDCPPNLSPIACKIAALLVTEGPKRVTQIVSAGICSDPTARTYLKAPYFTQRQDLAFEITSHGKEHFWV